MQSQDYLIDDRYTYDLDKVNQLVSDVNDVSNLSKSMHTLVEHQGELVDNIEYNITVSHGRVVLGTQDLKKAEYYSRNKCILGLIAVLLLVVIGLIIRVSFKFHDKN
jgi:syntaxin 16